jgi:hypothetical protein
MDTSAQQQAPSFESVWAILQETAREMKETDRKMKELQKAVGGITNNYGSFAEEYFFNSFEKGQKDFFGKKFNMIQKNVKAGWKKVEDEYDIVLYNDDSVAIIEVKFKAHENDIKELLAKPDTFKILFPYYKDFNIYLGLASMSFYPDVENECVKNGIAVIKQAGETVVINDKHLKSF